MNYVAKCFENANGVDCIFRVNIARKTMMRADDGFMRKMQHAQGYAPGIAKTLPGAFSKILCF